MIYTATPVGDATQTRGRLTASCLGAIGLINKLENYHKNLTFSPFPAIIPRACPNMDNTWTKFHLEYSNAAT